MNDKFRNVIVWKNEIKLKYNLKNVYKIQFIIIHIKESTNQVNLEIVLEFLAMLLQL